MSRLWIIHVIPWESKFRSHHFWIAHGTAACGCQRREQALPRCAVQMHNKNNVVKDPARVPSVCQPLRRAIPFRGPPTRRVLTCFTRSASRTGSWPRGASTSRDSDAGVCNQTQRTSPCCVRVVVSLLFARRRHRLCHPQRRKRVVSLYRTPKKRKAWRIIHPSPKSTRNLLVMLASTIP